MFEDYKWRGHSIATQLDKKAPQVQVATLGADAILIFNMFNLTNAEQNNIEVIETSTNYFTPKTNLTYYYSGFIVTVILWTIYFLTKYCKQEKLLTNSLPVLKSKLKNVSLTTSMTICFGDGPSGC